MITGWRIGKDKYASPPASAFDGEGARRYGGRWNRAGRRVAYASSSLALASLEYFVNLDPADAPRNLVAVQVNVPDEVATERIAVGRLPEDWQSYPYPEELHKIGDGWLDRRTSVCLLVPSVLIPQEDNLLINPDHMDFHRLIFHSPLAFAFDPRMWK